MERHWRHLSNCVRAALVLSTCIAVGRCWFGCLGHVTAPISFHRNLNLQGLEKGAVLVGAVQGQKPRMVDEVLTCMRDTLTDEKVRRNTQYVVPLRRVILVAKLTAYTEVCGTPFDSPVVPDWNSTFDGTCPGYCDFYPGPLARFAFIGTLRWNRVRQRDPREAGQGILSF